MGATTPLYLLPYPVPTDPADVPADMSALANRLEVVMGGALSPTPPASPSNGQLWAMSPQAGTVWVFRYNAGSASAYKWEFVGGPPMDVTSDTSQTSAGAAFWWATPVLTVPRAGDYRVWAWGEMHANIGAGTVIGFSMVLGDGAATFAPTAGWQMQIRFQTAGAAAVWQFPVALGPRTKTALASGATLKFWSPAPTGWDVTSDTRGIAIQPIRVS